MTDEDVIERVSCIWGVKTFSHQPTGPLSKKRYYRATIVGSAAALWMTWLRPYMSKRRKASIDAALLEHSAKESVTIRRSRSCKVAAENRKRGKRGEFVGYTSPEPEPTNKRGRRKAA